MQVDFSNTFVQAQLNEDVWVAVSGGFEGGNGGDQKELVLKLKKSLYGLVQAPLCWYNHLKAKLEAIGMKCSELDPCVFYGRG